jgi:hypothetical protein
MDGEKKEPRHRAMAGLADILPTLPRLSLVGLLLSRAPQTATGVEIPHPEESGQSGRLFREDCDSSSQSMPLRY